VKATKKQKADVAKPKKMGRTDAQKAIKALELINRLCVCVKNKRRPVLAMDRSGKLSSFTFEQAAGEVFEAMTGLPAADWIEPAPDKWKRKGGA